MTETWEAKTWEARIFVGFKEGYGGVEHTIEECKDVVQKFVDEIGCGVTVTPTAFIYTDGRENGAIVGLIN